MKDTNNLKDLEKEFLETFLSGIEEGYNENIKESMNNLFKKILTESIKNVKDTNNCEKSKDKIPELKESTIIGNKSFVKFIEISEKGKKHTIYIDKSKILSIIEYDNKIAIRMDIPEYSIYFVEGTLEEVLEKLEDKIIKSELN